MTRGGASPKRKGTTAEYLAKTYLELGDYYVVRSWGSLGPWDLLALRPGRAPLLIQVKAGDTGYLRPVERKALLEEAHRAGGLAVICAVPHPSSATFDGLRFWELTTMADREELIV